MKKYSYFFIKSIVAGSIAVAILSAISIFYNYTGVHIDNKTGATDYVWESEQLRTNMIEGFSWLKMDEYGFNNTSENAEKAMNEGVDILLMGSSHMEALQVSKDENLGAILNARLSDFNTYNIGMSGHDAYRVMDNVDAAISFYKPKEYLLMEIGEVKLDIVEMKAVIGRSAKKIPSYDSGLVYHMQKIPAFKWIYKSIEEWMSQSKVAFGNIFTVFATEMSVSEEHSYEALLDQFLDICAQACKETGCTPIIFLNQQSEILSDGEVVFPTDQEYLELFAKTCEKKGIVFIDMTPAFLKVYEEDKCLPHGFSNTYVGSGHLNKHGHKVLAEELIKVILEKKGEN